MRIMLYFMYWLILLKVLAIPFSVIWNIWDTDSVDLTKCFITEGIALVTSFSIGRLLEEIVNKK